MDQQEFDSKFVNLDECVLNALKLFSKRKLPNIDFIDETMIPFVAGSGNAYQTGRILFSRVHPVLADESDYEEQLQTKKLILGSGVLISSSGGKDAPRIAGAMVESGLEVKLFTCNEDAAAKEIVGKKNILLFPSIPEPYTYNTSTYGGMIFAKTKEDPKEVLRHIKGDVSDSLPDFLGNFSSFYLCIPNRFSRVQKMFQTKFEELFGRKVARDVFTVGFANEYATDVVSTSGELRINFGDINPKFGSKGLSVPLPRNCDYGGMMMTGYYVIGRIQRDLHPYFRESIVDWCNERGKKPFG